MKEPHADAPLTMGPEELRAALAAANIPVLLLVLRQLTGDSRWLEDPYRPTRTIAVDDNDTGGLSEDRQREIRDAAYDVLTSLRDGDAVVPDAPSGREIVDWVSVSLGEDVPEEYAPSMLQEAGFTDRTADVGWRGTRPDAADDFPIVVIGAGMAGICASVYLQRLGLPHVILERSPGLGGVWLDNDYPGAGVDTPSHLYSYSFAQKPDWTRYYPKQEELLAYFQGVAETHDVVSRIRFGHAVDRATWDEDTQRWTIGATGPDGHGVTFEARALVSCVGLLNEPAVPDIDGRQDFRGPSFHSAEWDHGVDLVGKRVAVVGTGASAVQIVPTIADETEEILVFQRSPQWLIPNPNYLREVLPRTRRLMKQVPYYLSFYRLRLIWMWQDKLLATLQRDPDWAHAGSINEANEKHRRFISNYMEEQLGHEQDLVDVVVPDYPPYGKRILMDNRWLECLGRDDVRLVPEGVDRFTESGVVTEDGVAYDADVVVFATGFQATEMLRSVEIRGRCGRTLRETWDVDDAFAYLGITVPGFPNFFLVGGPNTFLGHGGSAIFTTECAMAYIAKVLRDMLEGGVGSIDIDEGVARDYARRVDDRHANLIWTHPGMTNWFRNSKGRVVIVSPWRGVDYWHMTQEPDLGCYEVSPVNDTPGVRLQ